MGVIQRFKDIMSANINAMLDKAENPEKMIDQYMRNLEDDLGKVKAETASVMAEEARAKRAYDEALAEVQTKSRQMIRKQLQQETTIAFKVFYIQEKHRHPASRHLQPHHPTPLS